MISAERARQIAELAFPNGPERLAEDLRACVELSPLKGVAGWCIRGPITLIRLNASDAVVRQRFTLAHELAHLVLGTEPDIASEPFASDSLEERNADRLASEFLLPATQVGKFVSPDEPVDFKALERLAKSANVSLVAAACRVVDCVTELGLCNAALVCFTNGHEKWRFSPEIRFGRSEASQLLTNARAVRPDVCRQPLGNGHVVAASIHSMPEYELLFVQLLPEDIAGQPTREEQIRKLAGILFGEDLSFRQSVAYRLGAFRRSHPELSLDEAAGEFLRQMDTFPPNRREILQSPNGQDYVRLCLSKWYS